MAGTYLILLGFLSYFSLSTSTETGAVCDTNIRCDLNIPFTRFKRHPTDCTKSYICKGSGAKIYSCPVDKYFSEDLQTCVVPANNECDVRCSESQEPTIETSTEEALECVFSRCPASGGSTPYYLPHWDCSKYCVCKDHSIFTMECSEPLHFNANKNICDWPASAGCAAIRL